jgi:hypothetical protein
MMLNEYEIVAWYTFMKRQVFNVKSAENVINCAAYCAKKLLNPPSVLEVYDSYFCVYEKQFLKIFKEWRDGPGSGLQINPIECN